MLMLELDIIEEIYRYGGPTNIQKFDVVCRNDGGIEIDMFIKPIKSADYIEFDFIVEDNNKLKLPDDLFNL